MSAVRNRFLRRTGSTAVRVCIALASATVTLAAIELGLRIGGFEPRADYVISIGRERIRQPFPGLRYLYPGYSQFQQEWPSNPRGYFDSEHNRLTYTTNNFGFRSRDFSLSRTGKIRIAFLGDSFCWRVGVRRPDTFASITESDLNAGKEGDPTFEVCNSGLQGSNTAEEAALYERFVQHFRPDFVVIWYFLNDVNIPPKRFVDWRPRPTGGRLSEWRTRSRFLDLVVSKSRAIAFSRSLRCRVTEAHSVGSAGRQSVEHGLERVRALTERGLTRRLLVLMPWLTELDASDYPFSTVHRTVRDIAEKRGFSVLDLLPFLADYSAKDLWVHRDDHHLNEIGHAVAASAFVGFFRTELREGSGSLIALASSRIDDEPHPLDGNLPRNWPAPFAEAISAYPTIPPAPARRFVHDGRGDP
jgi:hypothetical protein